MANAPDAPAEGSRSTHLTDRWDDGAAAGLSEVELLRYRSNLLGVGSAHHQLRRRQHVGKGSVRRSADRRSRRGALGERFGRRSGIGEARRLRVAVSRQASRPSRRCIAAASTRTRCPAYFGHCTFNLNPRPASIDTPLHGFIPHRHVDHMHADAVIAIAAARNGERLTRTAFGGEVGWVPWQRPGFDLGLTVGRLAESDHALEGLILGGHGLMTWGPTSRACYDDDVEGDSARG